MAIEMKDYSFRAARFRYHTYHTVKNTIPYTDASGTASPISNRLAPSFRLNTYDSGTLTRNDAVIHCSITGSDMP